MENPTEQSVFEHLFRSDEYLEFKKSYNDLGYPATSEINLFEMYNILVQVPDTPTSNLSLLRQDETKVERHVQNILASLTNTLGTDCVNAAQICEDVRKLAEGGIFGHKAFASTDPLEPILWAFTTSMRAMTELSERLPIVFRIQAILRVSSSDVPVSIETIEYLTEPFFFVVFTGE